MARIVMNGSLKIMPEQPPTIVKAHRDLAKIHGRLISFKDELRASDIQKSIPLLTEKAVGINHDYCKILADCGQALKGEINTMSEQNIRYYTPVLTFVSRADNSHTVTPFMDYLSHLEDLFILRKSRGALAERRFWPFTNTEQYKDFIVERVEDSVQTCRSYLALLSNSMDSFVGKTDISSMLRRIFSVQKKVVLCKTSLGGDEGREERKANFSLQVEKSQLQAQEQVRVENLGPILFFLLQQVVNNAFKASVYLGSEKDGKVSFDSGWQSGYPQEMVIQDPKVLVKASRIASGSALVTVEDNGIGIPKMLLPRIFSNEAYPGIFQRFIISNGSTTRITPFVCDLTGTAIEVKSAPGAGTRFDITIPSLN